MAAPEGVHRMYLLAKRVTFFGFIAAGALGLLAFLFLHLWLGELFVLLGFPLILGAILWALAWIVEGFLLPPSGPRS